ncbi:MAG: thiamine pyrophosphate-binding protein [Leifsonia sp.]
MMAPSAPVRNGGDLVVETLERLGFDTLFGIPGQHALGLFDALRRGSLHYVGSRIENNAAFAADGYARATGRPAALFLSTGPGALTALAGLQEAHSTSVPMVVLVSQVPTPGLGGTRTSHLHQLDDQQASARNVVKSTRLVRTADGIPSAIAEAHREAMTHPRGPVWIEIPQDIILAQTTVPPVGDVARPVANPTARAELLDEASRLLAGAAKPVILAGGGVRRSGAESALLRLAESLRAVVITTPGGTGAFPWNHPLSGQSWIEDRLTTDLLEDADVLLAVGTGFGEVTSNYFTLAPRGTVIHIDAEPRRLGVHFPTLSIHADAAEALEALNARIQPRTADAEAEKTAADLIAGVAARLDAQPLEEERALLQAIRDGVPDGTHTYWDMTIAGYWAWSCWDARDGQFHSAQGAGGIGWAFGAALGGAVGRAERVLAVSGDGGAMYSISELAVAKQHNLPVTWLIIDDGGYGILREYMIDSFGEATGTELVRPDFVALATSFGVPAEDIPATDLEAALSRSWTETGPRVLVVRTHLDMFAPTHLPAH